METLAQTWMQKAVELRKSKQMESISSKYKKGKTAKKYFFIHERTFECTFELQPKLKTSATNIQTF